MMSKASAPVDRQRIVVTNKNAMSVVPKGSGPIFLTAPHRQSHQPDSDATVIHMPSSSPVRKKTFGRRVPWSIAKP